MSFRKHLESQGKSKSTVKHYTSYILDFISYLDADGTEVENTTAKDVLAYLNLLQKRGHENSTRSTRLNVIKQFMNWQLALGHRADNPITHLKIRGIKQQKLYPILDKQQLEQIYNQYQTPKEDDPNKNKNWFTTYKLAKQRNKAILSLMIHQGLTTPEIAKLTVNDLKLKAGKMYVAGSRKSNERTLELKSHQIIELMEYQYTTRKELLNYQEDQKTDLLFLAVPSAGKQKAAGGGNLQIWKSLTKEIKAQYNQAEGISFINFKQVRTSVITHWLKQYNLRQVQDMAGHRYVSSTEAYLVNNTEDLQKDVDQYHPF
jgi:site-specific recombinase XerD